MPCMWQPFLKTPFFRPWQPSKTALLLKNPVGIFSRDFLLLKGQKQFALATQDEPCVPLRSEKTKVV